jgi:hypothetical protein
LKNPAKPYDFSNRRVTILVAFAASDHIKSKSAVAPAAAPLITPVSIMGKS